MNIAVVDYGMGNLRSVSKALEHVAPKDRVLVTADPEAIRSADRVVVPGQGAMPDCMRQLTESGAREAVIAAAREKPFAKSSMPCRRSYCPLKKLARLTAQIEVVTK